MERIALSENKRLGCERLKSQLFITTFELLTEIIVSKAERKLVINNKGG